MVLISEQGLPVNNHGGVDGGSEHSVDPAHKQAQSRGPYWHKDDSYDKHSKTSLSVCLILRRWRRETKLPEEVFLLEELKPRANRQGQLLLVCWPTIGLLPASHMCRPDRHSCSVCLPEPSLPPNTRRLILGGAGWQ